MDKYETGKLERPKLFVWRGSETFTFEGGNEPKNSLPHPFYPDPNKKSSAGSLCPFCNILLEKGSSGDIKGCYREDTCPICGFRFTREIEFVPPGSNRWGWASDKISTLKEMDIDDSDLHINELGSHLKRRFSDIYPLSPHRFEQLVEDVFKNMGFYTRLTKSTRDGGYDISLIERSTGEQILVECKRYSKERKVTVETVRNFLGVQLIRGVPRGKIVTTTKFTSTAKVEAELVQKVSNYDLELIDADQLIRALDIYNTKLPPQYLCQWVQKIKK
ncbi:MAG: restriction endonuclease [Desulfobulbaceae bacterium]|nr:restriction endonuclease [Desulfobulbaceae bacterium]